LDTLGLWDAAVAWPEQIEAARLTTVAALEEVAWPATGSMSAVVVLGVHGAGAAVAAFGAPRSRVPIVVVPGFEVPAFVGPGTVVVAVSYGGSTAETLAAAQAAQQRGATVAVITSGGALAGWASSERVPRLPIDGSFPVERAAYPAEVVTLPLTLAHLGVLEEVGPMLQAAASTWERRRTAFAHLDGPAAEMARHIGRTLPIIYGATGLSAVAALRWKTQVNENAKTAAFAGEVPDVGHHEVAGWGQHGDVTRQVLTLITLRDAGENPLVARQFDLVVAATDEVMANVIPLWADGDSELGRFFDLVMFGDFVSLHLAGRESIDPGPAPALSDVAAALP
jgi:glucose/mannose-6-phosphate isomerase